MSKRPTDRELYGKVFNAMEALKQKRRAFGTMRHWPDDQVELGLDSASELWELLLELLDEILDARPCDCYAGNHPPQRSYHDEKPIRDKELWAFRWQSAKCGKMMYLKFVLVKDSRGDWQYFHIDCHPDRQ